VALENVVVTAIDAGGTQQSMWIQDPFFPDHAGIRLYFGAGPLPPGVAVGDLVIVHGVYGEFDGASQLTSPTVTTTAAFGGIAPTVAYPLDVATGGALAEWLEGMLVTVQNVTVTAATDAFGEFVVTDGLIVDDLIHAMPDQAVGTTYSSITGILHFANGNTKLEPRNAADVVP
jgi:predicted extracellular nuclease